MEIVENLNLSNDFILFNHKFAFCLIIATWHDSWAVTQRSIDLARAGYSTWVIVGTIFFLNLNQIFRIFDGDLFEIVFQSFFSYCSVDENKIDYPSEKRWDPDCHLIS